MGPVLQRLVAAALVPWLACAQHLQVRPRERAGRERLPQAVSATTVQMTGADFAPAFRALGKQVPVWGQPLETARRIFGIPERSGTYLYEVRTRRLMPVAPDGPLLGEVSEQEFVRDYLRWCGAASLGPGDCLRVLERNRTYSSHARYATALAIGWGSTLGEMRESLREMVNPSAVMGTLFAAMAMYLMLWTAPEPFSKGVAAALTIWLFGYLGFHPLWRLAKAWRQLVEEADAALDFEALCKAGEHFGEQAGPGAARLLILLTTLAIGGTAGMAVKGPSLPGFSLANAQTEGQLAVGLVAATAAESVLVGAQAVTITLAPGVLAMGAGNPAPGTEKGAGTIKVTEEGLAHVIERHTAGGALATGNKSLFVAGEDLPALIQKAGSATPTIQSSGRLAHTVDAGRIIGTDRVSGLPTSVYTVITDAGGNLITAFPGVP